MNVKTIIWMCIIFNKRDTKVSTFVWINLGLWIRLLVQTYLPATSIYLTIPKKGASKSGPYYLCDIFIRCYYYPLHSVILHKWEIVLTWNITTFSAAVRHIAEDKLSYYGRKTLHITINVHITIDVYFLKTLRTDFLKILMQCFRRQQKCWMKYLY